MGDISTAAFQFLASNPDYKWFALLAAMTPTMVVIIREAPKAWRRLVPRASNIEEMADSERKASEAMKSIALDFGVDRACISLFHNGTKSMANIHILKSSVLAEGLSGRVGSIISELQNRNLAEYGDYGYRIIKKHEYISVPDVESLRDSISGMHTILHLHLVKSIHIMPIFDQQSGRVDGCVFVEHCGDNVKLDKQTMDSIQARAQSVYNDLYIVNNGK